MIGSRGSGEEPPSPHWDLGLGPPGYAFAVAFGRLLPGVEYTDNAPPGYPAVRAIDMVVNKQRYISSVLAGEVQLGKLVRAEQHRCSSTRLILVGYSQGAEVTGDAYLAALGNKSLFKSLVGVVLFGDPLYNHSDASGVQTALQKRTQTALTRNGVLTGLGPLYVGAPHTFPRSTAGRVLSYCVSNDPICQGAISNSIAYGEHWLYTDLGDPQDAAEYFARRAGAGP